MESESTNQAQSRRKQRAFFLYPDLQAADVSSELELLICHWKERLRQGRYP